jgi:type VI protein secretion system component VasF
MAKRSSSSNLRRLQLCRPNMGRQKSFRLWLVLLHCAVLVWALALLLYSLLLRSNEHLHSFVH